jgi:hypothetical protein
MPPRPLGLRPQSPCHLARSGLSSGRFQARMFFPATAARHTWVRPVSPITAGRPVRHQSACDSPLSTDACQERATGSVTSLISGGLVQIPAPSLDPAAWRATGSLVIFPPILFFPPVSSVREILGQPDGACSVVRDGDPDLSGPLLMMFIR